MGAQAPRRAAWPCVARSSRWEARPARKRRRRSPPAAGRCERRADRRSLRTLHRRRGWHRRCRPCRWAIAALSQAVRRARPDADRDAGAASRMMAAAVGSGAVDGQGVGSAADHSRPRRTGRRELFVASKGLGQAGETHLFTRPWTAITRYARRGTDRYRQRPARHDAGRTKPTSTVDAPPASLPRSSRRRRTRSPRTRRSSGRTSPPSRPSSCPASARATPPATGPR